MAQSAAVDELEGDALSRKKGQITAFDLAYIEYAEEMEIPHLNIILHDQIENVAGR